MTYEQWIEKFKPIKNHIAGSAPFNGTLFETFGAEYDFIRQQPPNKIWTVVDAEGHSTIISPGHHFCNRLGYLVCEVEWEEGCDIEVFL